MSPKNHSDNFWILGMNHKHEDFLLTGKHHKDDSNLNLLYAYLPTRMGEEPFIIQSFFGHT